MAYINAEKTKAIRNALKAEFGKSVKFSVTMQHYSSLYVVILESEFFDDGANESVNQYYIDRNYTGETKEFLMKVDSIIREVGEWWDKSDLMTDYHNTAFYYTIKVGRWNKPHVNNK